MWATPPNLKLPKMLADTNFMQEMKGTIECICIILMQMFKQSCYSTKLTEEEWNVWAAIYSTPTSNVIPLKLKVAINTDAPVQHVYMV